MALLFFSLFNAILGLSLLFPIIAPLGRELGLSEVEVGTAFSTSYALMQFIASPWWGKKSEAWGRKPVLLIGVSGFALGFLMLGVITELGLSGAFGEGATGHAILLGSLFVTRIAGGALSSATLPTAQAYAADITSRDDRAKGMAVVGAAFGLAIVFGPVIGGTVAHFLGLVAPIWLAVIIGAINALLVWGLLPEPVRLAGKSVAPPPRLRPVARRAWDLLAAAIVISLASVSMEQTVGFYFQDRLHTTAAETPIYLAAALGAYGVLAVLMQGGVVRRYAVPPMLLLRIGLPLTAVGMAVLALSSDFSLLVLGMALQGLGNGLAMPGVTAALSLAVSDEEQGAVAGLNNSAQGLGRLLGPIVGTSLYGLAIQLPFTVSAALLALVALFTFVAPGARAIARAVPSQPTRVGK